MLVRIVNSEIPDQNLQNKSDLCLHCIYIKLSKQGDWGIPPPNIEELPPSPPLFSGI